MVWWVTVASILGFLSVSALSQQLAITRYDAVIWLIIAGFLALLLLTIALFSHAMWHKKSRQFNRFVIPVTGLCIVKYAVVAITTLLLAASYGLYQQQRYQQRILTAPITINAIIESAAMSDNVAQTLAFGNQQMTIGNGYTRQVVKIVATTPVNFTAPAANFSLPFSVLLTANLTEHSDWQNVLAAWQPGQTLSVKLALQPINAPSIANLPSNATPLRLGFDEARWLQQRGIQAKATLIDIHQTSPTNAAIRVDRDVLLAINLKVEQWRWQYRQKILASIERQLLHRSHQSEPSASLPTQQDNHALIQSYAILLGLLTGDKSLMDSDIKNLYQVTGISHLLAISGPHVLMLASIVALLLCWLVRQWLPTVLCRLPSRLLVLWVSVVVAAGYACFVGFELPAQRTFWMLLLVTLGSQWLIKARAYRSLAWVGLLMMWADTTAVWQAGFWLSFVAVALLLKFSEQVGVIEHLHRSQPDHTPPSVLAVMGGLLARLWEQIKGLFKLQLWLFVWMMPMVIWFFGKVSLISVLTNLVAVPLLGLVVVPLDMLAGLLAEVPIIGTALSQMIWALLAWLLQGFHQTLHYSVAVGAAKQWFVALSPSQLLMCVFATVIWFLQGVLPRLLIVPILLILVILPIEQQKLSEQVPVLAVMDNPKLTINLLVNGEDRWLILADNQPPSPSSTKKHGAKLQEKPRVAAPEDVSLLLERDVYPLLAQQHIHRLTGVISQTPSVLVNTMVQNLAATVPIEHYWLAGFDPLQPSQNFAGSEANVASKPLAAQISAQSCKAGQQWQHHQLQLKAISGWQLSLDIPQPQRLASQTCLIEITHQPPKSQPYRALILAGRSPLSLQMSEKMCLLAKSDLLIQPYQTPITSEGLSTVRPTLVHVVSGRTDYQNLNEDSTLQLLQWQNRLPFTTIVSSGVVGKQLYQLTNVQPTSDDSQTRH